MAEDRPTSTAPGRVAVALVHEDPPRVFLARDEMALSRVLALAIVADEDPAALDVGALTEIRDALLDEDWSAAVSAWIEATGVRVDVHPDEVVIGELSAESTAFDLRLSRLFSP